MPFDILKSATNKNNLLFFITDLVSLKNPINNVGTRELLCIKPGVTEVGNKMTDPNFTIGVQLLRKSAIQNSKD